MNLKIVTLCSILLSIPPFPSINQNLEDCTEVLGRNVQYEQQCYSPKTGVIYNLVPINEDYYKRVEEQVPW